MGHYSGTACPIHRPADELSPLIEVDVGEHHTKVAPVYPTESWSASTPFRRIGLLHQKYRDYFGVDDPDVLVVAGTSQQFNPTLDSSVIERARASDPEAARAEWDAEFRSDIAALLDDLSLNQFAA